MTAQVRSSIRVQRFEVMASVLAAATLGAAAVLVAVRLAAIELPSDCWAVVYGEVGAGAERVAACEGPVRQFLGINASEASRVMAAMAFLPLVIGLMLGVPTVSREIEAGTAPTVWALAASRTSWLSWRLLAIGAVALTVLTGLALASELLWVVRAPTGVPNRFDDTGLHGPVVIAKGLAAFGLAVLIGAALGRTLPAIITATAASITAVAMGLLIRGLFEGESGINGDSAAGSQDLFGAGWLFDNVEAAFLGLVGFVALALTFAVVNRRRTS